MCLTDEVSERKPEQQVEREDVSGKLRCMVGRKHESNGWYEDSALSPLRRVNSNINGILRGSVFSFLAAACFVLAHKQKGTVYEQSSKYADMENNARTHRTGSGYVFAFAHSSCVLNILILCLSFSVLLTVCSNLTYICLLVCCKRIDLVLRISHIFILLNVISMWPLRAAYMHTKHRAKMIPTKWKRKRNLSAIAFFIQWEIHKVIIRFSTFPFNKHQRRS